MAASSKELKSRVVAYLVEQLKSGSSIKAEPGNEGSKSVLDPGCSQPGSSVRGQRPTPPVGPADLTRLQNENPMMWKVITMCQSEEGVRRFVLEVLGPDIEEIKKEIEWMRSSLAFEKGEESSESTGEGVRL